ncbi:IS21 family transposase [Bdellovibrionota bacterium FG-1]
MDRRIVELFLQGKSAREIMRQLGTGDRRVSKVRCLAEEYGYLLRRGATGTPGVPLPPYPEALFPDGPDGRASKASEANTLILARRPWIAERLLAGWHPITVYEELGIPVSRSSFYRFLHRHALCELGDNARKRVVPEIRHRPGEALVLDWGKLRDVVDPATGKKRTLWAFVGVLGYSRFMMVRLVWTNETRLTLTAIEDMLREIGGVPERVTSDNPKCFALEASRYEPLLNPAFERMAGHYGMRIECLPPADPQKKGKVERLMPYVRRLYEAHGEAWHGIDESQAYLDRKVALANERMHGTTRMKPLEQLLQVEAAHLKPLPALAYAPEEVSDGKVRRDGHVRFDSKYYSLDESFIGKTVLILASASQVSLYHEGKLAEVHERIPVNDPSRSKSTKPHHLKPWEREMKDGSLYRRRAQALGPDVDQFVLQLLNQGDGFIDTRKIWGVLSFDKSFTPAQINEACRQALALGTLSYRMVKSLLKLLPTQPVGQGAADAGTFPESHRENNSNKFVRPMSVYEEQLRLLH